MCGMSCSGCLFDCGRGGQPPIRISGIRETDAFAIAVTVFVTPGPAVASAIAHLAGQLGVRVRHVHGGGLVTDVHDGHAETGQLVPDRLDVAALQAEHPPDPSFVQECRDQLRDGSGLSCMHGSSLSDDGDPASTLGTPPAPA